MGAQRRGDMNIQPRPLTKWQEHEIKCRFIDDPVRNGILRQMAELSMFLRVPKAIMKDGEIISTSWEWADKNAEKLYTESEKMLLEYSALLLEQLKEAA